MHTISLKSRMVLSVSALFVSVVTILAWTALAYFEREIEGTVAKHQLALAGQLAGNIDDKLDIIQMSLQAAASGISEKVPVTRNDAITYLENKTTLLSLFNAGIFLASPDGSTIADVSPYPAEQRVDHAVRAPLITRTLINRRPQISAPFTYTAMPGQPLLMFTAPLVNTSGQISAILGGTVNLLGQSFFDDLVSAKIGSTGYIYLYDSQRTIITHPDKSRIMKRDVPPGSNRLFDMALNGFEGSGQTVNSRGVPLLSTFKHLRTTDWILAVNFPSKEAYAPVFRARSYFIAATIISSLLAMALVWILMRRLTGHLVAMTRHVATLPNREGSEKIIRIESDDEIGTLAAAFNGMLSELDQKQQKLEKLNEELEQRVIDRTCQLQEANSELEAFNYSLSHDLRTPINLIEGYGSLILETWGSTMDEECRKYLQLICESGERMDQLVDAMLEFSRTNKGELLIERVDLGAMAQELAVGKQLAEPDRQIEIRIPTGIDAQCDPRLMRAALGNLIDNAWKYTTEKPDPVIEFGMSEDNGKRTYFIRDNGDGFDMAQADRLFVPFKRLHSAARFPGNGIGLATVRRIIERHGGKIWAEGETGKGATFYFSLGDSLFQEVLL